MTLAIFDFLISDNIIAKNIANIIKINALFINGFCIKKMMTAKTANKSETPTLFLTFVPLSEPGLPTILSTDTIKRIPLTANNILFTDVNSTEKDIFSKRTRAPKLLLSPSTCKSIAIKISLSLAKIQKRGLPCKQTEQPFYDNKQYYTIPKQEHLRPR